MTIPQNLGSEKLYVTPNVAEGIFVRSGAGPQFTALASAFIGDALEVTDSPSVALPNIGVRGAWIQVRTIKGIVGWINARFVDQVTVQPTAPAVVQPPAAPPTPVPTTPAPTVPVPTAPPVAPPPTTPPLVVPLPSGQPPLYVHTTYAQGQYVRSGPGPQYPDITSVTTSQKIEALGDRTTNTAKLGKNGEWIQVRSPQGIVGWAAAWYLEVWPEIAVWTEGHALAGLHGPTEAWANRWDEGAFQMIAQARIEAVKLLASNDLLIFGPDRVTSIINRLRSIGVRFVVARLFAKFSSPKTAQEFVNEVGPAAKVLFERGVKHFEVHNEPNLNLPESPEGMFVAWQNGQQFAQFYEDSVSLLKQQFQLTDAQFGFPGVSPVSFVEPQRRYLMSQFLNEADATVRRADFVCMHQYWGGDNSTYLDALNSIRTFCQKYPSKVVLVSEFANTNIYVSRDIKGREYAAFYIEAKKLPQNLGAVFSYVMKSGGDYLDQTWAGSSIAQTVGQRTVV